MRLRLDFGTSYFNDQSVLEALNQRKEPTILLTTYALLLQIPIGVPAGVIAAVKKELFCRPVR